MLWLRPVVSANHLTLEAFISVPEGSLLPVVLVCIAQSGETLQGQLLRVCCIRLHFACAQASSKMKSQGKQSLRR